jgi:hypothetical protein
LRENIFLTKFEPKISYRLGREFSVKKGKIKNQYMPELSVYYCICQGKKAKLFMENDFL